MAKIFRPLPLSGLALILAACQSHPAAAPAPATAPATASATAPATAPGGEALAQASCGSCHAVGRTGSSSNPNAPPFAAIANQEGLTAETLSTWLRGAHNYPGEMNFYLRAPEADALVAYMLTLRDPNYVRPPD